MLSLCSFSVIGADILDKTNTNAFTFGRLKEEQTWWQLEPDQRVYFDEVVFLFGLWLFIDKVHSLLFGPAFYLTSSRSSD